MSSWPKLVVSILGMIRSFALWPPQTTDFSGPGGFRLDWPPAKSHLESQVDGPFFCLKNGHLWRRSISSRFLRSVTDFGHDKTCQNLHPNLPESCKEVASRADAFERFFRGHQTTQPVTDFLPHKTKTHCWESKSAFGTDPGYQKISLKSPKIKKTLAPPLLPIYQQTLPLGAAFSRSTTSSSSSGSAKLPRGRMGEGTLDERSLRFLAQVVVAVSSKNPSPKS